MTAYIIGKTIGEIDQQIGNKIRELRIKHHFSQTALGEQLGVTFQQVQKYEKGINRITAVRLNEVSKLFNVPITTFFKEERKSRKVKNPPLQTSVPQRNSGRY
jgi:transcriptional regulator with XRE-family HTH domain